jgi:hypothetical protein
VPIPVEVDCGKQDDIHSVNFEYLQCGSVHLVLRFSVQVRT